jgi:hypothetical protein
VPATIRSQIATTVAAERLESCSAAGRRRAVRGDAWSGPDVSTGVGRDSGCGVPAAVDRWITRSQNFCSRCNDNSPQSRAINNTSSGEQAMNTSNVSLPCGTARQLRASWDEAVVTDGEDDSRDVSIEVRPLSGACSPTAKWQLVIEGSWN